METCLRCKGLGVLLFTYSIEPKYDSLIECPYCGGCGTVDWIDNILIRRRYSIKITFVYFIEQSHCERIGREMGWEHLESYKKDPFRFVRDFCIKNEMVEKRL